MKILVLGSEGQIGSAFCDYIETKTKDTVVRWDLEISNQHDLSSDIQNVYRHLYPVAKEVDAILFLAYNVGGSKFLNAIDKTRNYISSNVLLMDNTFNVLSSAQKPVLFASSQMSNMLQTNYGLLKQLGERYCWSDYTNNIWVTRFWNIYGIENPKSIKSHVITDFISQAYYNKHIKMLSDGSEERQFMYAEDASRALHYWCKNFNTIDRKKYLDITSSEWTSVMNVAKIIAKELNAEITPGKNNDLQMKIKNEPDSYFMNHLINDPDFISNYTSLEKGIQKIIWKMKEKGYLYVAAQDSLGTI